MVKHGLYHTKAYKAWSYAKTRCYNPNYIDYKNYGGLGIKVSEEFLNDPVSFCNYVGEPPELGMSLDRIDPNKDYERGNLRWTTPQKQSTNRKKRSDNKTGITGVSIEIRGSVKYAIAQWKEVVEGKTYTRSKWFNYARYGEEALELAIKTRSIAIDQLNKSGQEYTEYHGK